MSDLDFGTITGGIVKAIDGSNPNGEFDAILSNSELDRDGEVVLPGAFMPLPASIPVFRDHDWRSGADPVGKAAPYYEGVVLKAHGVFASTERGQATRTLVREGLLDSMSVGFLNAKREKANGRTTVSRGDLFETSFTAVPVNAGARVLVAKAGARNSGVDQQRLNEIHDLVVAAGADCAAGTSGKAIDPDDELMALAKAIEIRAIAAMNGVYLEDQEQVTARLRILSAQYRK